MDNSSLRSRRHESGKLGLFPVLAPLVETEWFLPQVLVLVGAIAAAYVVYRYKNK